jgi:uncharacterized integral membrane protein
VTRWIAFLVIALLIAVFAVENAHPVPVRLLFWTAPRLSLSLIILLAALVGAVVGVIGGAWDQHRRRSRPQGRPGTESFVVGGEAGGTDEEPLPR